MRIVLAIAVIGAGVFTTVIWIDGKKNREGVEAPSSPARGDMRTLRRSIEGDVRAYASPEVTHESEVSQDELLESHVNVVEGPAGLTFQDPPEEISTHAHLLQREIEEGEAFVNELSEQATNLRRIIFNNKYASGEYVIVGPSESFEAPKGARTTKAIGLSDGSSAYMVLMRGEDSEYETLLQDVKSERDRVQSLRAHLQNARDADREEE